MRKFLVAILLVPVLLNGLGVAQAEEVLQQIISREDTRFSCTNACLTIGRDGLVYLCSGGNSSFVLRMTRDGKDKAGGAITYAAANATANAAGVIASANGHFAHTLTLYDAAFNKTDGVSDFLVSDQAGWDAPGHVEAGASGDFYGIDQHRDRILRISPRGKVLKSYVIPRDADGKEWWAAEFRVCEKTEAFHVLARNGELRCLGFDGKVRWTKRAALASQWYLHGNAFDVDPDGVLYVLENHSDSVLRFSPEGEPLPAIKLQLGADKPVGDELWFNNVRVSGGDLLIRRSHPTELFQVYALATGERKQIVYSAHERLTVKLASLVWTAGENVPCTISFDAAGASIKPHWRVWLRPYDSNTYQELAAKDGQVQVPATLAGLYVLKVTPEVQPWQQGTVSEYIVRALIEVRQTGVTGTVAVMTPACRVYYGAGEAIPVSVSLRSPQGKDPALVTVRLLDAQAQPLAQGKVSAAPSGETTTLLLPGTLTAGLAPGEYVLVAAAPGLNSGTQRLVLGPGPDPAPFFQVQYGDYGALFPEATPWDAADIVAAHAARVQRLGFNLIVDRLGSPLQFGGFEWAGQSRALIDVWDKRLAADPAGVAPAQVKTASPLQQTMAAFSAAGPHEMAILMGNDAGLPLGTGYDNRKPAEIMAALDKVTNAMAPYPAFRGWSWSSNWWVFEKKGSAAAATPEEKAAYEAALRRAQDTGAWDPVLDTVAGRRLGLAVEAQQLFNDALRKLPSGPALVTASAAPYRQVEAYPPITLANVDEVDLHIQWEQIGVPYHAPHNVDFYKRPGKRGWGHPEIWNDDGTGGQILPSLFMMLMRGADGVGCSGPVPPPWVTQDDPRIGFFGTASVFRSLNGFLRQYGPWLATLENDDRVALLADGRMFKIDEWKGVMGQHFARVLEAYITCLHAHQPASIVFAEDVKPDTFKKYKAVLVVDQRVEFEPAVKAALLAAKVVGTALFRDGTCRPELVQEFQPLDVSFDKIEKDASAAGDDAAFWRFEQYAKANLPVVKSALDAVTPPAAKIASDEVLISQRRNGTARALFVVNNAFLPLTPGQLWRMNLAQTNRLPVMTPISLESKGGEAIYEVMARTQVTGANVAPQADLRSLPARIFVVLPQPIAQVEMSGPKDAVPAGAPFAWRVRVLDAKGQSLTTTVPVGVRLLGPTGEVLREVFTAAGPDGASGVFTAPLGIPGGKLALEAAELLSGKTATLAIATTPATAPVAISATAPVSAPATPVAATAQARGAKAASSTPAEESFGPHIKDMVVAEGGDLVVMSMMNWDQNLYALDTKSGQVQWRQRAGHYFAFAPEALKQGVAVQGFDFQSAEGYHLYLVKNDGTLERRFALPGLPQRLPHRFVPGLIHDRIDSFAVPVNGRWVAAAGDLGLAVWDADGKRLLWQDWGKAQRQTAMLAAVSDRILLVVKGMDVTAIQPVTGEKLWQRLLASTGEMRSIVTAPGAGVTAFLTTTDGGRVFLVRNGEVLRVLASAGGALALNTDATLVAVTDANQLKLYSVADGLQWSFAGDSPLRSPQFAPDGKRVAAASDDGSVYVLGVDGAQLFAKDMGAKTIPAWLPGGDLLLGTWMGTVCRLDAQYRELWRRQLVPKPIEASAILAADGAPTTKIPATEWGNAAAQPLAITPNVLAQTPVRIRLVPSGGWGGWAELAQDPKALYDGKADAPPLPWIPWNYVGFFAETSPINYLLIDAFNRQLRVSGITLFEDPAHPESWLRDGVFEYWDAAKEEWVRVQALLSDAAVHSHVFAKPVEAARFRILLPWGAVGNLGLGEIVFHGELLGGSHPDVAAKRPQAVLFDEQEDVPKFLGDFGKKVTLKLDDAFSGGKSLQVAANATVMATWTPPFGHRLPNWAFPIAEAPEPGQYRYVQFAWKALAPETTGITVGFGPDNGGILALYAGTPVTGVEGAKTVKVADAPPREWTTVRVDLWKAFGNPVTIGNLLLSASGGPALFDQIVLGRTEADLPAATGK